MEGCVQHGTEGEEVSSNSDWKLALMSYCRQETNSTRLATLREYRASIERELQEICNDVLRVLDSHLLPYTSNQESHVFYHKM